MTPVRRRPQEKRGHAGRSRSELVIFAGNLTENRFPALASRFSAHFPEPHALTTQRFDSPARAICARLSADRQQRAIAADPGPNSHMSCVDFFLRVNFAAGARCFPLRDSIRFVKRFPHTIQVPGRVACNAR
jgi:hypothetical protein